MKKSIDKIIFLISVIGFIFAVGVITTEYKLFPYSIIQSAVHSAKDLSVNWRSYLEQEPTKFLSPSYYDGTGVTINKTDDVSKGLTLLTGLFDNKVSIILIDLKGNIVHKWVPDFKLIWPASSNNEIHDKSRFEQFPLNAWDLEIHGSHLYPDGSILFNYNYQLVKMDLNGQLLWVHSYGNHHSISVDVDGSFWIPSQVVHRVKGGALPMVKPPYTEDTIMHIASNGEVLEEFSIAKMLLDSKLTGILFPKRNWKNPYYGTISDPTHLNDIEVLLPKDAQQFPNFESGDLLVSLRNINLLLVIDPIKKVIKWHQTGPWLRQHDPDFLPTGKIGVFNNNNDSTDNGSLFGGSNIMTVDPQSRKTTVVYPINNQEKFYTSHLGKQQFQPNGNILITEAEKGRAFEVNSEGEIVWEFINRYDETRVSTIQEATRYPENYFTIPIGIDIPSKLNI